MKLFFDVTTIHYLKAGEQATGIPRVESFFAQLLGQMDKNTHNIYFCRDAQEWVHQSSGKNLLSSEVTEDSIFLSVGATWNYQKVFEVFRDVHWSKVRKYFLIHDLVPIIFPYFYEKGFNNNFRGWCQKVMDIAEGVIHYSENTKSDFSRLIGTPHRFIRFPIGDNVLDESRQESPFNHPVDPFLLMVGTIEDRKNHRVMLDVVRRLAETDIPAFKLVVVGKKGWMPSLIGREMVEDEILQRHVVWLEDVSDAQLVWLYKNARVQVFPSLYEGWGLPVAEGFRLGLPAIVACNSSLVEIYPEGSIFVDSRDLSGWCDAVKSAILEEPSFLKMKETVKSYIPLSWENAVRSVYESLEG